MERELVISDQSFSRRRPKFYRTIEMLRMTVCMYIVRKSHRGTNRTTNLTIVGDIRSSGIIDAPPLPTDDFMLKRWSVHATVKNRRFEAKYCPGHILHVCRLSQYKCAKQYNSHTFAQSRTSFLVQAHPGSGFHQFWGIAQVWTIEVRDNWAGRAACAYVTPL